MPEIEEEKLIKLSSNSGELLVLLPKTHMNFFNHRCDLNTLIIQADRKEKIFKDYFFVPVHW